MKKEKTIASKFEMFDALMENIPDSIYFKDLNSKFIKISKATAKRFKINNSDEILGKTDFDIFTKKCAEKSFRDEQNIIETNVPFIKIEEKETYEDREERWVSTIKMPLYDKKGKIIGTFGISRGITERKKAEKLLAESEERYRILFNTSPEGILITEIRTQKIKYANPSICKMLGYTGKELTVMDIADIHPKEDLQVVLTKFQDNISIRNPGTLLLLKKDGTNFYAEVTGALITINGQKYGAGFFHDITERKKTEEKILFLSYHDQLTGLYNRRFFEEELKRLDIKRQLPISIIMADVDGLKHVNDSYGHEKGDKLLIAVSEIIKNSCRIEDIIARIGGDEFIIFLPKTSGKDALDVIDRIRKASKFSKLDNKINISISLGLSNKNDLNEKMEQIIEKADKNMYDDKASKKNNKDIG